MGLVHLGCGLGDHHQEGKVMVQEDNAGLVLVQQQLWDLAVLEQWAAAIAIPSFLAACIGPHDVGTEFIQLALNKSLKV